MKDRIDLHIHSHCSDGDRSPTDIVREASEAGVSLLALTDHDTMDGVAEALDAGKAFGVSVVTGVEMDNRFDQELHILGLAVDRNHAPLCTQLRLAKERRLERNAKIGERLLSLGCDVRPFLQTTKGVMTRLHYAAALVDAGCVKSVSEAFDRFLSRGRPAYVSVDRPAPDVVIRLIRDAGGIAVLAHPCHLKGNVHSIVNELVSLGIGGIEAYYPTSTEGQTELFLSLAAQHRLLVTCGSDFHGARRLHATLGCAYCENELLEKTRRELLSRL